MSKTSNHARAPLCAAFVERMREVFGEVQVNLVSEGDLMLGGEVIGNWVQPFMAPILKQQPARKKK